jgi:large subunit ribosomal protein L15
MKLHDLQPRHGATKRRKRVGRGISYRSLPFKRGFTNINRIVWHEVNLDNLSELKADAEVTPDSLVEAGILRDARKPVVLLGRGEIKVPLKIRVHRITQGAKKKIEAAGGTVELLEV